MRAFIVTLALMAVACEMAVDFPGEIAKDKPFDERNEVAALACEAEEVQFGLGAGPCPYGGAGDQPEVCFTEGESNVEMVLTCTETSGFEAQLTAVTASLRTGTAQTIRDWSRRTPADNVVKPGGTVVIPLDLRIDDHDATAWDSDGGSPSSVRDGLAEGTIRVEVVGVDQHGQPISVYPPIAVPARLTTGSSETGCWCDNTPDICDAGDSSATSVANAKKCTANKCPCDPDCTGGREACADDGYCDTWCPSGGGVNHDPNCETFLNPYCK